MVSTESRNRIRCRSTSLYVCNKCCQKYQLRITPTIERRKRYEYQWNSFVLHEILDARTYAHTHNQSKCSHDLTKQQISIWFYSYYNAIEWYFNTCLFALIFIFVIEFSTLIVLYSSAFYILTSKSFCTKRNRIATQPTHISSISCTMKQFDVAPQYTLTLCLSLRRWISIVVNHNVISGELCFRL